MSSDGIASVINKYKKYNFKYIRKRDKNYYDGLNQAIDLAKGKYVAILNAGDVYYHKEILKIVMNKILSLSVIFVFKLKIL